jgi:hypothetical protein
VHPDLFFDLLFAGGAFCGAGLLGESLINGQAAEGFAWSVSPFFKCNLKSMASTHATLFFFLSGSW